MILKYLILILANKDYPLLKKNGIIYITYYHKENKEITKKYLLYT